MRLSFLVVILMVAALFLVACREEEEAASQRTSRPMETSTVAIDGVPVTFEAIDMGGQSAMGGEEAAQLFVIERQEGWRDFWSLHRGGVIDDAEPPDVDFSHEMVLIAMDKTQPSGGYSFQIDAIDVVAGALTVHVTRLIPGPDCVVTAVLTRPFHIVRTESSDLRSEWMVNDEVYDCE